MILKEYVYYNLKENVYIYYGWIKIFCFEIIYKLENKNNFYGF